MSGGAAGTLFAPADARAPRGWHLALAAGVFPPLLLGFTASGFANRLAFAGWAVVVAVGHAVLLRASWQRGWPVAGRAALALGWAALGMSAFAGLVERHGEILDLGYRAMAWAAYTATLTRPGSWQAAAGLLAVGAALAATRVRLAARREPS